MIIATTSPAHIHRQLVAKLHMTMLSTLSLPHVHVTEKKAA
jgi:hypothetical protein